MKYVFGTKGNIEVLKTKSSTHSDLTGYRSVERKYPDQTITDNFRVVHKLDSQTDVEGNCYDWYEIDKHYRIVDKSWVVADDLAQTRTDLEDAMIENDIATNERITDIEDAILELDEAINGGADNG